MKQRIVKIIKRWSGLHRLVTNVYYAVRFVPEKRIRVTKLPEGIWPAEPWETFGAVIEVVR